MTFALKVMPGELAAAVAACGHVADSARKIPIYAATAVDVAGGRAVFMATNGEQAVRAEVAAAGGGRACFATDMLRAKLPHLGATEPAAFTGEETHATLKQGRSRWRVPLVLDYFPAELVREVGGAGFSTDAAGFAAALKAALVACEPADGRPALTGVHVDPAAGRITGADGRRIHITACAMPGGAPFIIPGPVAAKVAALFGGVGGPIHVTATENIAGFGVQGLYFTTTLVAAQYPAVGQFFDATPPGRAECTAGAFRAAVSAAAAIGDDTKGGRLRLAIGAAGIVITARNSGGEEGEAECEAAVDGPDCAVGVSLRFALDALGSLADAERLAIGYTDERSPVFFWPAGAEKSAARLVMPQTFA